MNTELKSSLPHVSYPNAAQKKWMYNEQSNMTTSTTYSIQIYLVYQ
jgi:hypothetical protein